MGNPWAESDWQDLLGEEVQVDQEYKRTSAVLILNDKGILKFVLEYLLNNVNSATGKYCILYFNQPLMELGPIDVVKIQALLVQVDSIQDKTTAWFGESIYQASSIMKKEKTLKNIVVITKVDPFTTDTEVTQVAVKSDDLVKSKIKVHLLGMSDKVDFKKFKRLNPQCFVEDQVWTPSDFERLKDNLKEIRDGKAVALDLLFYLSDKVVIGLKGYKNIVEMKVPTGQKIDPRSRRPVKNKVAYLDSLTAKELTKSQIAYYYSFGGEKCVFTKAEIDHIKDWGTPSVCLIGFRPCSALKDKFNVTTSYFGVPNEARIPGSTSVMAHLIDRMLNKGVIGFGTMVAKKGAALRLVAIIPSIQGGDRFNLVPLPFADEMRPIPSSIVDLPNDEHVKLADDIISNYTKDYQTVSNPALEKTEMNEVVDHTIPEYDSILQNCGQAIQIFNRVMAEASPPPTEEPKKERAKPAPKRKKEAEVSEPVYDNDVKEAIAAGLLSKYKVPDLVAILKAANQPVKSKKKADLLAAIDTIYASL